MRSKIGRAFFVVLGGGLVLSLSPAHTHTLALSIFMKVTRIFFPAAAPTSFDFANVFSVRNVEISMAMAAEGNEAGGEKEEEERETVEEVKLMRFPLILHVKAFCLFLILLCVALFSR